MERVRKLQGVVRRETALSEICRFHLIVEAEPMSFQELQIEPILHWPGKPLRNDPARPEGHMKPMKTTL